MMLTVRHKFWGGVEVVDTESGEVLAEAETAEDAAALLPALEGEQKRREPGLLDLIFGS